MTTGDRDVIRARIEASLKQDFEKAVRMNDRVVSQVLRDLIREYVYRASIGEVWEPGAAIKKQILKGK
ncbi:hypothetical protein L0Z26_29395 (plasmid) [Burkholderia multivorans]|uniref:hypothetical protein n=1 Tax=Burkholderia multivorans TaxID=87883 RepID=UPI002018716C|nr:hypothetical protein [Burkholderia multivorans]MCO1345954.1 hypothetical protein [Burkholderia multivorans]MCO1445301.1 hypothetical protein [Burkholderia multivorans]UQO32603.1 hypothetical protein L0Z21_29090 [Burkholderia multivorans]UQO45751.1 hypothetical protein L0Z43_28915 [Burkholderia multivorans]